MANQFVIDEEKLADAKVLDRGHPPMKMVPFQQFPQMVYNHKASKPGHIIERNNPVTGAIIETHVQERVISKFVSTQAELDAALESGWQTKPPVFPVESVEVEDEAPRRGRPKAS